MSGQTVKPRVLKVIPVEPLHLGTRSMGGIDAFSIDEVSQTPPPSTILGALGQAMGISINIDCNRLRDRYDFSDLRELVKKLLQQDRDIGTKTYSEKPILWGPLVRIDSTDYIPTIAGLLKLTDAGEYVRNAVNGNGKVELAKYISTEARIGINLNRATKTVSRMFKTKYVRYEKQGLEIRYALNIPTIQLRDGVVRVGGEDRAAMIKLTEEEVDQGNGEYAIALQPILIHSSEGIADIRDIKGLECVEEVYGTYDGEKFKVRVMNIGLGFSEACGLRRPILKALPQGTVMKLKNAQECNDARAIGILAELGYGSIYRTKTKTQQNQA